MRHSRGCSHISSLATNVVSLAAALLCTLAAAGPWPPSARARAAALVAQMTLPEKLSLMQGSGEGGYAGTLPAIPRLGIPEMTLEDSPQGVGDGLQHVTAFPCALTVAASWDPALMEEWGAAMGLEQFRKGTTIMLGPGTNLARVPLNGRLYEYYSEEPTLSSALVAAVVRGVQSNNVSACVKHFIGNSQVRAMSKNRATSKSFPHLLRCLPTLRPSLLFLAALTRRPPSPGVATRQRGR